MFRICLLNVIVRLYYDTGSINASMSSVKIGAKPIDRKPKGFFVKNFSKEKFHPLEWQPMLSD